jgi:hypothetical protein
LTLVPPKSMPIAVVNSLMRIVFRADCKQVCRSQFPRPGGDSSKKPRHLEYATLWIAPAE